MSIISLLVVSLSVIIAAISILVILTTGKVIISIKRIADSPHPYPHQIRGKPSFISVATLVSLVVGYFLNSWCLVLLMFATVVFATFLTTFYSKLYAEIEVINGDDTRVIKPEDGFIIYSSKFNDYRVCYNLNENDKRIHTYAASKVVNTVKLGEKL